MTRSVRTAFAAVLLAAGAGVPAHADTCTFQYTVTVSPGVVPPKSVTTPAVTVPCPGPQDQPVATPVWATTDNGPGYYNGVWPWIRIKRGGTIFFANTHDRPHAYRGSGFDSGAVQPLRAREVLGVSGLKVGYYKVYDLDGRWVADLFVDP